MDSHARHPSLEPEDAAASAVDADRPRNDQPLPPLPDGGLAAAMPPWLSEPEGQSTAATVETAEDIDPATFLVDDDLPTWLRDLVDRERREPADAPSSLPAPVTAPTRPVRLSPRPPNAAERTTNATGSPSPGVEIGKPDAPRLVSGSTLDEARMSGSLLPTLVVLAVILLTILLYLLATDLL